jgi:hypothetical protein
MIFHDISRKSAKLGIHKTFEQPKPTGMDGMIFPNIEHMALRSARRPEPSPSAVHEDPPIHNSSDPIPKGW